MPFSIRPLRRFSLHCSVTFTSTIKERHDASIPETIV